MSLRGVRTASMLSSACRSCLQREAILTNCWTGSSSLVPARTSLRRRSRARVGGRSYRGNRCSVMRCLVNSSLSLYGRDRDSAMSRGALLPWPTLMKVRNRLGLDVVGAAASRRPASTGAREDRATEAFASRAAGTGAQVGGGLLPEGSRAWSCVELWKRRWLSGTGADYDRDELVPCLLALCLCGTRGRFTPSKSMGCSGERMVARAGRDAWC